MLHFKVVGDGLSPNQRDVFLYNKFLPTDGKLLKLIKIKLTCKGWEQEINYEFRMYDM